MPVNIRVCVLVGFSFSSFLCLFINVCYMFEYVYCYMLYVRLCACYYATCMWPEVNVQ